MPEELVDGEGTPDPKGVRLDIPLAIYYYPQTKFAKVMFSHVSVCPRGGVPGQVPPWAGTPPGQVDPRWAGTRPWAGTPLPGQVHPPRQVHPPLQCMLGYGQQAGGSHPTGMHSCSEKFYEKEKQWTDRRLL